MFTSLIHIIATHFNTITKRTKVSKIYMPSNPCRKRGKLSLRVRLVKMLCAEIHNLVRNVKLGGWMCFFWIRSTEMERFFFPFFQERVSSFLLYTRSIQLISQLSIHPFIHFKTLLFSQGWFRLRSVQKVIESGIYTDGPYSCLPSH